MSEQTENTTGHQNDDATNPSDHEKAPPQDDFREALSNLSAALDRFGRAAESRARQEWAQGRPEINRATDEIRKGVEGLVRRSTDAVDTLARKLSRDDAPGATPPEATVTEAQAPDAASADSDDASSADPATNGSAPTA